MIKNIIFDLGGVLLDLNWQGCVEAFEALGADDVRKHIHTYGSKGVFGDLEHGRINESEFYTGLRKLIGKDIEDDRLRSAWNTIIADFPNHRIEMLKKLKGQFKLYVLSNTSYIHTKCYEKMMVDNSGLRMNDLFDGIFYSYDLGVSKPSAEIYSLMLKQSGIHPAETVFIDDAEANTEAAYKHGIHVIHKPDTVEVTSFDFDHIENNPKFVPAI